MPSSTSPRLRARVLFLAPVLALALLAAPPLESEHGSAASAASPARSGIYLGVAGDIATARQKTGEALSAHAYGYFERVVPSGRMLTVRFEKFQPWSTTAGLTSSSQSYKDIARWADTLKSRGPEIFVAFHHEPESTGNTKYGTAREYRKAFQKVVSIFRARGANNVIFTWQMTAWAFRAKSTAYNYAPSWYPGDSYVDTVAADPYNWYTCGHGTGKWVSLKTLMDPVLAFARTHGKSVALAEFASVRESRRPDWISAGGRYLAANDDVVAAAFYFNRAPTNKANSDCTWPLSSSADYSALKELARQAIFKP